MVNLAVMVEAEWDGDAGVWVASSDDVPGLVAEHSDFRTLQGHPADASSGAGGSGAHLRPRDGEGTRAHRSLMADYRRDLI